MTEQQSEKGFDARAFLQTLTSRPGVYRMIDGEGQVIYVGKAGSLKKRISSYFFRSRQGPRTRAMLEQVQRIELTITRTEAEALILENNLIKSIKPRYNVLLRDDKSYPYIHLSAHPDFPRLSFYRGSRKEPGRYFGPFPSAGAVRESLSLLQKLFPVRQCEDSFYRNRSRPCLQYQIKRCTAPCVGLVDPEIYQEDVRHGVLFLEGRSAEVIDELVERMERAATALEFEKAARYRDQIARLRRVQERQYISGKNVDCDVIAGVVKGGVACVQLFRIRGGQNLGNKSFFPRLPDDSDAAGTLAAFLPQFYLDRYVPEEVLINHPVEDRQILQSVLEEQSGHRVTISWGFRGERARWVEMAEDNARHALAARLAGKSGMQQRTQQLQEELGLAAPPERMECFDISHTMGESAVASCVVFDAEGPVKSDYRRFNIAGIQAGDDFGAMRQALTRRYSRLRREGARLPDVLFIDGGKGQLAVARAVLDELEVEGVTTVAVAKGADRKPGLETLFLSVSGTPIILPPDSLALHLIQQIRDEAHRFAITGHRQRRGRTRRTSVLEAIAGMGPKRRQRLLKRFGGLREIARAGVEDLTNVPGISSELARRIYDAFHSEEA
jgi:excinuclease ABC subunit C